MIPHVNVYSGLTPEQYDNLLTPAGGGYLSEIILAIRRLVHLILHCEWITDAKLVDRLTRYIQTPESVIDANVQKIYQAFRTRIAESQTRPALETQLQYLQQKIDPANPWPKSVDPISLASPFSLDLRYFVTKPAFWMIGTKETYVTDRVNLPDLNLVEIFDNQAVCIDLQALTEKVKALVGQIDQIFEKNFQSLGSSDLRDKDKYLTMLRGGLKQIHDHYDAVLNYVQTTYINNGQRQVTFPAERTPDKVMFSWRVLAKPENQLKSIEKMLKEIEVDIGIYSRFRQHLENVLNRMMRDDPNWQTLRPEVINYPPASRESLAMDLRICRQFMIERSAYYAGYFAEDGGGTSNAVFSFLKNILDSEFKLENKFNEGAIAIDNGCLTYSDHQSGSKTWIPACFAGDHIHAVSYVYTHGNGDPHFVLLDNLSRPKQKISLEQMCELAKQQELLVGPDTNKPPLTPLPMTWVIPQWERNNCFFAAALIELAVFQFYRKQAQ